MLLHFLFPALPKEQELLISGQQLNKSKIFKQPTHGNITCTSVWLTTDVEVTLTSKAGTNASKAIHRYDCLYESSVTHHFDLYQGEKDTFVCQAIYDDGKHTMLVERTLSVQEAGESVFCQMPKVE